MAPAKRGRQLDVIEPFAGGYLNAVDAKGRVSLPASFRSTIERRFRTAGTQRSEADQKMILVGEHERFRCLEAFDPTYLPTFSAALARRIAQQEGIDEMAALEDAEAEGLQTKEWVKFDDAGRMVLSADLRDIAGITDYAWFGAAGGRFQIWNPATCREQQADKPRIVNVLERAMRDKGLL